MSSVAIIPARGGSRRIPGKNIKEFHGQPILVYSIKTAQASGLFDAGIWVSTEDSDIARVAWDAGAKVHPRQKALAEDHVGTQEVTRAALAELYPRGSPAKLPDFTCCIYPTAPLMLVADLHAGYVLAAARFKPYAFAVGLDGVGAGQWFWGQTAAFLDEVPLEGNSELFHLPVERTCDINTTEDWIRAERLWANHFRPEGPL